MVSVMGHYMMPLSLQGHFSHLGVRVWPSIWSVAPDFWPSRLLDWVAIDTEMSTVSWNYQISPFRLSTMAYARKLRNDRACASCVQFMVGYESIYSPPSDSFAGVKGTFNLGTGTCQPNQTTRLAIQGAVTIHHSLRLPNQTSGIVQLFGPTQGCQNVSHRCWKILAGTLRLCLVHKVQFIFKEWWSMHLQYKVWWTQGGESPG